MADRTEIWKDVVGYEGLYLISDSGRVLSPTKIVDIGLGRKQLKPQRILKAAIGSHGYLAVALCRDKIQTSTCIHRMLAEAFIENTHGHRCINHKDGNKLNNDLSNLEWVSHGTNNKHAYDTGLKKPWRKVDSNQVREIRELYHVGGYKVSDLAKKYKISQPLTSEIVHYKVRIYG